MADKRRAGRLRKSEPPAKKRKLSTPAAESSAQKEQDTVADTETDADPVQDAVEEIREPTPLPDKIYATKPLPSTHAPQALDLSLEEYQTVASSAVLEASLERSRQEWMLGHFLETYWVKPSSRKDAPPPPPNNPQKTWMKEIGTCSLTVEPMIFDVTAYFVREPGMAPVAPAVQRHNQYAVNNGVVPAAPSPYGTPYRPQPTYQTPQPTQQPEYYNRNPPPIQKPAQSPMIGGSLQGHRATQSAGQSTSYAGPPQHAPVAHSTQVAHSTPAPTTNRNHPDPVIQMLATRASSDSGLKALMKIVATGTANQEQLRIFQRHIDDLNEIIQRNKEVQPQPVHVSPAPTPHRPAGPPVGYVSNQPSRTSTPNSGTSQYPPPPPPVAPQRYVPAASLPVVLEFNGPSASPDRFLFPPHSILEFLSPYTMLASFLVFGKGDTAVETRGFDVETEYYEPVTIRLDVTEANRDVLEYMRKSVKSADEVRKWMEERMRACKRAPIRFLALRLPHESQLDETDAVEEMAVPEVAPKKVKQAPKKEKEKPIVAEAEVEPPKEPPQPVSVVEEEKPEEVSNARRSSRGRKKSVRISEIEAS